VSTVGRAESACGGPELPLESPRLWHHFVGLFCAFTAALAAVRRGAPRSASVAALLATAATRSAANSRMCESKRGIRLLSADVRRVRTLLLIHSTQRKPYTQMDDLKMLLLSHSPL
jgi:hypothetical protein